MLSKQVASKQYSVTAGWLMDFIGKRGQNAGRFLKSMIFWFLFSKKRNNPYTEKQCISTTIPFGN
jgi:hypothetical protein